MEIPTDKHSLLLTFKHGWGDVMQSQILLRHLRAAYPDWFIGIEVKPDAMALVEGFADVVHSCISNERYNLGHREKYKKRHYCHWERPEACVDNVPSTKPTRALKQYWGIEPKKELYYYEAHVPTPALETFADWWDSIGNPALAVIHYSTINPEGGKSLTDTEGSLLVDLALELNCLPIVIDYYDRCKGLELKEGYRFTKHYDPINIADSSGMLALIANASYFFGIDSGPAHIAGAFPTVESFVFWKGTHPLHCYDLAEHVTHIVPVDHYDKIKATAYSQRLEHANWLHANYYLDEYLHLETFLQRAIERMRQEEDWLLFSDTLNTFDEAQYRLEMEA